MAKEDFIKLKGKVVEVLPNATFRIQLSGNNLIVLGYISGKMKKNQITVLLGDTVDVELTTYDLTRGRITFRYR